MFVWAGLFTVAPASAASYTYTELIEDTIDNDIIAAFFNDLQRTRTLTGSPNEVEGNDATITAENSLSANWGFVTIDPFSWSHTFNPSVAPSTITSAKLELTVFTLLGLPFSTVSLDLTPAGVLNGGFFSFSNTNLGVNAALLGDGLLNVRVVPVLDVLLIKSSKLTVEYDTDLADIPEPTSVVLLLTGVAAMGRRRLRGRA